MRMTLRYDMRQPDPAVNLHEFYEACIEQCVWADRLGFEEVFIGEHHGADDGYIPSSIVLASAIAARTKNIKVHLSALLLPMHHPLRLAEDLAVLDIISNGRLNITAGMGYRPSEFEMLGVDHKKRLRIYLDAIDTLQKAWKAEPFEFEGRTVCVRPKPISPGGPKLIMGGSAEAAAERAARMGLDFMPGHPKLYENYKEERAKLGLPPPPPLPNFGPTFLYVTHEPERGLGHRRSADPARDEFVCSLGQGTRHRLDALQRRRQSRRDQGQSAVPGRDAGAGRRFRAIARAARRTADPSAVRWPRCEAARGRASSSSSAKHCR